MATAVMEGSMHMGWGRFEWYLRQWVKAAYRMTRRSHQVCMRMWCVHMHMCACICEYMCEDVCTDLWVCLCVSMCTHTFMYIHVWKGALRRGWSTQVGKEVEKGHQVHFVSRRIDWERSLKPDYKGLGAKSPFSASLSLLTLLWVEAEDHTPHLVPAGGRLDLITWGSATGKCMVCSFPSSLPPPLAHPGPLWFPWAHQGQACRHRSSRPRCVQHHMRGWELSISR